MVDAVSNFPMTAVVDDSKGHGYAGLSHLISQGNAADGFRSAMLQQAQDAKDSARDVATLRSELAVLAKDNAVTAERLERENQNRLREIEEKIRIDGETTRNLIERHRCDDLAAENAELKAKILAMSTPVPTPAP